MDSRQLTASLNYAAPVSDRPRFFTHAAPGAEPPRPPDRHLLPIHDARAERTQLEREGFELVRFVDPVDPLDSEAVRSDGYPRVEALVRGATGASRVVAFDHNVRSADRDKQGKSGIQSPVKFAHNDYTEGSGPQRVRDLLPDEAECLLGSRFAVINVWRPLRGPVQDIPLGVCDARSIHDGDLVASDLVYPDRTGEIYSLRFRPGHRWYYFPDMQPDEAMLLKCYDSSRDGRSRFTAHAAFRDPTAAADAAPRESIEVRTLAFFQDVSGPSGSEASR